MLYIYYVFIHVWCEKQINEMKWNEMKWNEIKWSMTVKEIWDTEYAYALLLWVPTLDLCCVNWSTDTNCNTIWLWISVVLYSERKCCCKVTQIIFPTFVRGNNTYQMLKILLVIINSQRNLVMYNIHAFRNRMFNFDHVVCVWGGGG